MAIRRGMLLFRQGDVLGSLVEFDKAIELDTRQKAYLWQRGLSLYYVDRFEEGADQFRIDVAQNPNDTEESIWCFLCEAQLYGVDEARKRFLEVSYSRVFTGENHQIIRMSKMVIKALLKGSFLINVICIKMVPHFTIFHWKLSDT